MPLFRNILPLISNVCKPRVFGTSSICFREVWKRDNVRRKLNRKDEGTEGDKYMDLHFKMEQTVAFPDENLYDLMIGDQKFVDIPILQIRCTKNNTVMTILTAHDHPQFKRPSVICHRSCGMDGFKNCRKGTSVAAQTTGLNLGKIALQKGVDSVRIMVRGLGPGRMSSVKGIEMAGLKIVSLSDTTEQPDPRMRPRKARRI